MKVIAGVLIGATVTAIICWYWSTIVIWIFSVPADIDYWRVK